MEKELPKRKTTRLNNFDYSSTGAYFITICVSDRKHLLSEIVKTSSNVECDANNYAVGEGLAPPEYSVKLKPCGKIMKEQLLLLEQRFTGISIKDYVIMPDHIHAILFIRENTGGASPSPTLNDIVCAYKSLTSRVCKQQYGIEKLFQRSYADHIIRDTEDYETRRKYIYDNPRRWYYKHLNVRPFDK